MVRNGRKKRLVLLGICCHVGGLAVFSRICHPKPVTYLVCCAERCMTATYKL
jgi:hypothetical protein